MTATISNIQILLEEINLPNCALKIKQNMLNTVKKIFVWLIISAEL